jgi:hypothetical protein
MAESAPDGTQSTSYTPAEPIRVRTADCGAKVKFFYEPSPPNTGRPDSQTDGCHCPVCADPEDTTGRCHYFDEDRACYCKRCTDPDVDGDCYQDGARCGRCERRDWSALSVASDPPICSRCAFRLFHESEQQSLEEWGT